MTPARVLWQSINDQHILFLFQLLLQQLQRPPFEQPFPNQPKAPNPLDDLVDTEKEYVADLKVLLQVRSLQPNRTQLKIKYYF
jgi:hypothetical protein